MQDCLVVENPANRILQAVENSCRKARVFSIIYFFYQISVITEFMRATVFAAAAFAKVG